jgi:leader peptidase (prepilin peptidase) / N-methyltransferase
VARVSDPWLRALVVLPIGLVIGSFMTVVAARVPAGESVVRPRSRCLSCGTPIANRDNVPVVGWVLLRGRCRSCGARISLLYPGLELTTALLIAGAFFVYASLWIAVAVAALLALMPAIAVIDIQHRIIPNRLMYPALVAFPIYLVVAAIAGAPVDLARMLIGFALYGGVLFVVAAVSRGMGMGDVKLAALLGALFGALGLRYVGVAAGSAIVLGGVGGLVALAIGRGRKSAIPFGPYLAAGAVAAAFWGRPIADWYLRTFLNP